jgi:hypothetical protein
MDETMYERVKKICTLYPSAKGSYNILTARYFWYYYGRKFGCTFEDLLNLPSSESITRLFRKAVEAGDIEPSDAILKRREKQRLKIKDFL